MNDKTAQADCHRILAVGFGVRTLVPLKTALERKGEKSFVLSSAAEAEVLLVNGDIPGVAEVVRKVRAAVQPLVVAVVVSTHLRLDIPDTLSLLGPLTAKSLSTMLRHVARIGKKQGSESVPEAPAQVDTCMPASSVAMSSSLSSVVVETNLGGTSSSELAGAGLAGYWGAGQQTPGSAQAANRDC